MPCLYLDVVYIQPKMTVFSRVALPMMDSESREDQPPFPGKCTADDLSLPTKRGTVGSRVPGWVPRSIKNT